MIRSYWQDFTVIWDQDPPFQKSIESLKTNYSQISITGPDLDPEKIEKFDDRFGCQILHFLQKSTKIIIFEPFLNI